MTAVMWLLLIAVFVVALLLLWRWHATSSASNVGGPETDVLRASERFGMHLNASTGLVLQTTDEHTSQHGHYLATACDLAYLPASSGVTQYAEKLNLVARLISVDNTQCYVGQNAESIVIAFRGSEKPTSIDGFKDWLLTNARNFLVLPEGRIGTDFAAAGVGARFHRGFMSALDEIWQPMHAAVDEAYRNHKRPVWVTGHSLGGAIALLAAWRLHQRFLPVHRICTFGAPMVGNQATAEAYHREFPNRIVRYVDLGDMVPKLPATSLFSNQYGHVQREIVLGDNLASSNQLLAATEHMNTETDGIDPSTADGLWNDLHSGISAHLMDNYISQIAEHNDLGDPMARSRGKENCEDDDTRGRER